jgi:uncharacterized protein YggE
MLTGMSWVIRPLLVACLAWLAAGCATTAAAVDRASDDAIVVTGTGRFSAAPDTVQLVLGVEAQAATLGEATADAARRMGAVVSRVKSFGVADADVATIAYTVDPRMAPPDPARREEPPRIVGYQVTNLAQVTVRKLTDAGPILDAAVAAGANAVRGIRFTLADSAAAQAQARASAVGDALVKARQLAAAADVKLGRVLSIREAAVSQPLPMRAMAMSMRADATPIEPGQLEIVVTVELRQAIAR